VKVLDFSLTKSAQRLQDAAPEESTLTLTEALTAEMAVVGTAAYMSPEQACGKELNWKSNPNSRSLSVPETQAKSS
jgi:hypothetical protein